MKEEDLLKNYPRLYHMAEDASWDSVVKHGLLSTIELLDHYEFDGEERRKLESERRPGIGQDIAGRIAIGRGARPEADDAIRTGKMPDGRYDARRVVRNFERPSLLLAVEGSPPRTPRGRGPIATSRRRSSRWIRQAWSARIGTSLRSVRSTAVPRSTIRCRGAAARSCPLPTFRSRSVERP